MIKASSSVEGEIVLGGDFTGTASVPVLINTGVTSGTYLLSKYITCDLKGRIISIGAETQANIDALVDAAYISSPSSFTIVGGRPVLIVQDATNVDFGQVQLGDNTGTTGTIPFNLASASVFGHLKTDSTFKYNSGNDDLEIDPLKMMFNQSGVAISTAVINPTIVAPSSKTSFTGSINLPGTEAAGVAMIALSNSNCTALEIDAEFNPIAGMSGCASTGSLICRFYRDFSGKWFSAISTDGITWDTYKVAAPPDAGGTLQPRVSGMQVIGSTFVVIGNKTNALYSDNWSAYSTDGINWTYNSAPWTAGYYVNSGLAVGFGKLVGVGKYGTNNTIFAVSTTDGINWTLTTSATSLNYDLATIAYTDGVSSGTTAVMIATATGVAVATNLWYSLNGTTWTASSGLSTVQILPYTTANSSGIYIAKQNGASGYPIRLRYSSGIQVSTASATTTTILSLFVDDHDDLYINGSRKLAGWTTYSNVSLYSYAHPVRLGTQYVFCELSARNLGGGGAGTGGGGGGGASGTYTLIASNSSGIVLPPTPYSGIRREICFNLPYNQSPFVDSNNDYVVGTILRLVIKNGVGVADVYKDRKLEFNFKHTGIAKVENNNERKFMDELSYKTFTAICTSSTEWLVFEE